MTRSAVVVGGTSGVGAHIAARLAETGWKVTATGRRVPTDDTGSRDVEYVILELLDAVALPTLTRLVAERKPRLIVYNATRYVQVADGQPTPSELRDVFEVNALLPYRLLLEYLTHTDPTLDCSCVLVNSDAIYSANAESGVYAASKAALRVLTAALADQCRSTATSVSTLLLGPLADRRKLDEFERIASQRNITIDQVTRTFFRRSNPSVVIDSLIDFESCFRSVDYIAGLGSVANGMVCRLDGGSAGSLV